VLTFHRIDLKALESVYCVSSIVDLGKAKKELKTGFNGILGILFNCVSCDTGILAKSAILGFSEVSAN
tara:strand:+ start:1662 stop:1865 length:204 start_codon:yes stop_codon:yes gene_type:complete